MADVCLFYVFFGLENVLDTMISGHFGVLDETSTGGHEGTDLFTVIFYDSYCTFIVFILNLTSLNFIQLQECIMSTPSSVNKYFKCSIVPVI